MARRSKRLSSRNGGKERGAEPETKELMDVDEQKDQNMEIDAEVAKTNERIATTHCGHVKSIGLLTKGSFKKSEKSRCTECSPAASGRWLCLHPSCIDSITLCGSKNGEQQHATEHYQNDPSHCVMLNTSNMRVFCFICNVEVDKNNNEPPLTNELLNCLTEIRKTEPRNGSSKTKAKAQNPIEIAVELADTKGELLDRSSIQNRPYVKEMEDEFEADFPKGLTGLNNCGNTCYFNAVIQSLSNCPPFSDFFRGKGDLRQFSIREPRAANTMAQLIQNLWSAQRLPSISPISMLKKVAEAHAQFRGTQQQDAQELMRCLLQLLHTELSRPKYEHELNIARSFHRDTKRRRNWTISGSNDRNFDGADSGWSSEGDTPSSSADSRSTKRKKGEKRQQHANKLIGYTSIISDIFDGQLTSTVRCLTCKNTSTTKETFQDLSLPIPSKKQLDKIASEKDEGVSSFATDDSGSLWSWLTWLYTFAPYSFFSSESISLEDCLSVFFTPDKLCGDDMYSCEKCAKLRNGIKTVRISHLPEVLCIHIKRFRHDPSGSTNHKISSRVNFPLCGLDMSPFSDSDESALYDLCSFISHEGGSAESGHYISYARNEIDGNWYEFDDSIVTKLDTAYLMTKEAYVLFYQRRATEECEITKEHVRFALSPENVTLPKSTTHCCISTEWLNKFNTFSCVGPINNYDFLCVHGNLLPSRSAHISSLCTHIHVSLWEFLTNRFGGGPMTRELHHCLVCDQKWKQLQERKKTELEKFKQIEQTMDAWQRDGLEKCLYAHYLPPFMISRNWFSSWINFVHDPLAEPPGTIDNNMILRKNDQNQFFLLPNGNSIPLDRELFLFLKQIYGGGPEVNNSKFALFFINHRT
ncbi:hypothetical protein WR25_16616 isoform J [Diploscapter pachys]|uniref:Ubiquitin carboxyl-terminal hydrolase n=1 Tax=Diploscapter pachys TaxID=2018661 RepID=A0A2A2L5M5_9BILA|nr:hypothetical protein WR25_16616 isoform J [Diploscapter pachys]